MGNIIYEETHDSYCLIHDFENITIEHKIENLEIIYKFNKQDFDKVYYLLETDILNGYFIIKIIVNETLILDNKSLKKLSINNLLNDNTISLIFNKKNEIIDNSMEEYLWFIQLIRYELFNYEKPSYFYFKTWKNRQQCFSKSQLINILNKLHKH